MKFEKSADKTAPLYIMHKDMTYLYSEIAMKEFVVLATFLFFQLAHAATDPRCDEPAAEEGYIFPYLGDCTKYVECTSGEATIQTCPDDLWFNEVIQSCDHQNVSGCVPLVCPPGVVDYYAYPSDCTHYIECYHGTPELHTCPEDFYFNLAEKRCVSAPASGCGEYSSTVEPDWTTPEHTACWGVLPNVIELKPVEGSCTNFIECVGSQATEITCPPGLYFDSDRQMCDQPELANCDGSTGTPDSSTSTTITPTTPEGYDDPRCADGNTEYWPYPECTKFIECHLGHGYLMDCPSGLYFTEGKKICEDPSISDCGRATVTANPDTTLPATQNPYCPWPSSIEYVYPYPGDCTKYMECNGPELEVLDCPSGLHFNPTLFACDYPYAAGCA